jgi:hypothetical protein
MDFMKIGWEGLDWIHLTQDRDQWRVLMNMLIPSGSIRWRISWLDE